MAGSGQYTQHGVSVWVNGESATSSSTFTEATSRGTTQNQNTDVLTTKYRHITDDGAGGFFGDPANGIINYVSGAFTLRCVADRVSKGFQSTYEKASSFSASTDSENQTVTAYGKDPTTNGAAKSGSSNHDRRGGIDYNSSVSETLAAGTIHVTYRPSATGVTPHSMTHPMNPVTLDLLPNSTDYVIPNTVQFTWMGHTYVDQDGSVYIDPVIDGSGAVTQLGTLAGTIDYHMGVVQLEYYLVTNSNPPTMVSMFSSPSMFKTASVYFRTIAAPVKPTGLTVSVLACDGEQIICTSDLQGVVSGPHATGKIDYENGVVEINFGDTVADASLTAEDKLEWWYDAADVDGNGDIFRPVSVYPRTLTYNVVTFQFIPLDAGIIGLDPVRLPADGRVPIYKVGDVVVIANHQTVAPATYTNGQTANCGRVRLARVIVYNNDGSEVTTGYSVDLDTGIVTFDNVAGMLMPVTVEHHVEDMLLLSEVQITGLLKSTRPLTHDFPTQDTYVCSALLIGDMRSRVSVLFDQQTWTNVWDDAVIGSNATATFNNTAYPIVVANDGTITERWALKFTTSTTFDIIGENVGVIGTGSTGSPLSPINPETLQPYWTIDNLGFGAGWVAGNVIRFNTIGALFPVWIARTVRQGDPTAIEDTFSILIRGDIDRP